MPLPNEEVIAKAIRIEYDAETNKLLIVFEATTEAARQHILKNWTDSDIDYIVKDKHLIRRK